MGIDRALIMDNKTTNTLFFKIILKDIGIN